MAWVASLPVRALGSSSSLSLLGSRDDKANDGIILLQNDKQVESINANRWKLGSSFAIKRQLFLPIVVVFVCVADNAANLSFETAKKVERETIFVIIGRQLSCRLD